MVHEDFYVHNELWDATCPDDDIVRWTQNGSDLAQGRFVICIGCFEKRLGRQLTRRDFTGEPGALGGDPPSRRYVDRWEATPQASRRTPSRLWRDSSPAWHWRSFTTLRVT